MTIHLVDGKTVFGKIVLSKNCCFTCKHSHLLFTVIGERSIRSIDKLDRIKFLDGTPELVSVCNKRNFSCSTKVIGRCAKGFTAGFLKCREGCWEKM